MNRKRSGGRLLTAAALGLAALASCAGAAPASGPAPSVEPLTGPADDAVEAAKRVERVERDKGDKNADAGAPPDAGPDAAPRCPYGEVSDPHRGFVRCLTPDERDAGWLPPPPQTPPAAADLSDAGAKDPAPVPAVVGPPPLVDIGAPKFENGEVPRAEKALTKAATDIAKCVAEHGGLTAATGTLKIQFLVRNRGRAEGVEILSAKGLSEGAASCVRVLLKNKPIGPPTADPVGVTVTISLKPPAK